MILTHTYIFNCFLNIIIITINYVSTIKGIRYNLILCIIILQMSITVELVQPENKIRVHVSLIYMQGSQLSISLVLISLTCQTFWALPQFLVCLQASWFAKQMPICTNNPDTIGEVCCFSRL